jgi:hypothetical protein
VFGRLRKKDHGFKASLDSRAQGQNGLHSETLSQNTTTIITPQIQNPVAKEQILNDFAYRRYLE